MTGFGAPGACVPCFVLGVMMTGCGAAPKPVAPPQARPAPVATSKPAASVPSGPVRPQAATGKWDPVLDPGVNLRVVARRYVGDAEVLSIDVPDPAVLPQGLFVDTNTW